MPSSYDPPKRATRYPKWKIELFRGAQRRTERSEPEPGVIRDFADPVAAEGRSIVENDAIQSEMRIPKELR
jgi:hypothetical protein